MHQQPPTAPFSPKRSSKAGQRSGVSGRVVSFILRPLPWCSLPSALHPETPQALLPQSTGSRRPSADPSFPGGQTIISFLTPKDRLERRAHHALPVADEEPYSDRK